MARHFVYSTLTNDQLYTNWLPPVERGSLPIKDTEVLIKGGANRATKMLITPRGVVTEVDDEQLAALEKNYDFNRHTKAGHIRVRSDEVHPEVAVAADMKQKDESAPLTPMDFPDGPDGVKITEKDDKPKKGMGDRLRSMIG